MLNNDHQKPNCENAEGLVSYLYGETENRAKFELHLKNCSACADELAAFSGVRSSFNDWKIAFSAIETPEIAIPYEKTQTVSSEPLGGSPAKASWLENFRQVLSLTPAWTLAGAVGLALVLGFIFVALNRTDENHLAQTNKQEKKAVVSPTAEIKDKNELAVKNEEVKPANETPPAPRNEVAKTEDQDKNESVKISTNAKPAPKPEKAVPNNPPANRPNLPKTNKKPVEKKELPTLSPFDEDEDKTLRLADLAEEIDTIE